VKLFPALFALALLAAALVPAPASAAYDYQGTVVAIGDSITSAGLTPDDEKYPAVLGRYLGTDIINKGIPGEPTFDMVSRFEEDVAANNAAMVIIMGGVNDISRRTSASDGSADEIKENLSKLYSLARADNMIVIACTILPNDTFHNWQNDRIKEVNAWIKTQAGNGIIVADTNAALRSASNPDKYNPEYVRDGVHPNSSGYKAIADAIFAVAPTSLAANNISRPSADASEALPQPLNGIDLSALPWLPIAGLAAIAALVAIAVAVNRGRRGPEGPR